MVVVGLTAKADLAARWVKGRVKEAKKEKRGVVEVMVITGLVRPASIAFWGDDQSDCEFSLSEGGGICRGEENFVLEVELARLGDDRGVSQRKFYPRDSDPAAGVPRTLQVPMRICKGQEEARAHCDGGLRPEQIRSMFQVPPQQQSLIVRIIVTHHHFLMIKLDVIECMGGQPLPSSPKDTFS